MSGTLINIIIQLITGGDWRTCRWRRGEERQRPTGNTIAGALGGVARGSLLTSVIPMLSRADKAAAKACGQELGDRSQFSRLKPGTRENSRSLSVTSVASIARACAAIQVSFAPIGVPWRSSRARILP